MNKTTLYLLCGLPGSGKTHFAKNLENVNTVRFTLDEEFFKKFGKDYDKTKYAEFEENLKEEILEKSKQLVKENKNVILDFGFWKKKDREVIKAMFEKLGGEVKLIFFDITKETRYKRVFGREKDGQHDLNLEALEKFEKEFEEPKNEKEGLFTEAGILFEYCQVLNNEKHFLIKTQREGISAIYLSEDKSKILRIGEKTKIEKDLTNHKKLLSQGYPVSEILEEGIVGEFSYFIEKSLGEKLFGEIFADDYEKQGNISDDNFDLLIEESKKLLTAHINDSVLENRFAETVTGLHVDWLTDELPELKEKILKRLELVQEKLKVFPFVFSHGDYNPYNIFPDGVIDFEDGFYAPIIFDVYGLFVYPIHFPLKKDIELEINGRYRYTETQRIKYFTEMDKILLEHGFPKGSDFFEEIKFLKGIWLAVRMQKWPKMQEYRYKMFGELL